MEIKARLSFVLAQPGLEVKAPMLFSEFTVTPLFIIFLLVCKYIWKVTL